MAACKISLMRDVFSAWKPKVVEDIFQTQGRGAAFWCGFSGFISEFIGFFMILHPLLCGTFLMQLQYTDHGRRCGPLQFKGFWGHSIKESNVSWNVCECYTTVVMPYEVSLRISPTHHPQNHKRWRDMDDMVIFDGASNKSNTLGRTKSGNMMGIKRSKIWMFP